jgi:hypothetical protein
VIETPGACRAARRRHQEFLARFAETLRAGRSGEGLPADLEELLLGGAVSLIARYVETGRAERLPEVTAELVQYLLVPYLGRRETRRVAGEAA